jgi:hypothetical protein
MFQSLRGFHAAVNITTPASAPPWSAIEKIRQKGEMGEMSKCKPPKESA